MPERFHANFKKKVWQSFLICAIWIGLGTYLIGFAGYPRHFQAQWLCSAAVAMAIQSVGASCLFLTAVKRPEEEGRYFLNRLYKTEAVKLLAVSVFFVAGLKAQLWGLSIFLMAFLSLQMIFYGCLGLSLKHFKNNSQCHAFR